MALQCHPSLFSKANLVPRILYKPQDLTGLWAIYHKPTPTQTSVAARGNYRPSLSRINIHQDEAARHQLYLRSMNCHFVVINWLLLTPFELWFHISTWSVIWPTDSFTIGHIRYINIPTLLRRFQDKLLYLVLFSLYPSLFWELRDKRNFKKLRFWPESLGAVLEYWYIELWSKPKLRFWSAQSGAHLFFVPHKCTFLRAPSRKL